MINKELHIEVDNKKLVIGPYNSDVIFSNDGKSFTKVPKKFEYLRLYQNDQLVLMSLEGNLKEIEMSSEMDFENIFSSLYRKGVIFYQEQLEYPEKSLWKDDQRRLLVNFSNRLHGGSLFNLVHYIGNDNIDYRISIVDRKDLDRKLENDFKTMECSPLFLTELAE